ncbi:UNVERIFIED_CONTAM: hypothetical protein Slati_3885800 [Sesamum latifolium]|uniref:Uncharacterized protein n=1 Tax=Sesamum latifolium TaxID=2727402 RepID=A0AAW2TMI0_9LAMI
MLSLEKDGAPGHSTDLLKGSLTSGDRKPISSFASEDLDHMLTLVLAKGTKSGSGRGFYEEARGQGGAIARGSGRAAGIKEGGRDEVSEG